MQLGVFIPIGNNGWLISTTSPQYKPSFDLNKTIVQKAEGFGFDFALSMIKWASFTIPSTCSVLIPTPSSTFGFEIISVHKITLAAIKSFFC